MTAERTELTAGALAFFAAVVCFYLIGSGAVRKPAETYDVQARFNQTEGLVAGDGVRLAGIKVGRVADLRLDEYYGVVATLTLPAKIRLPDDSGAAVQSTGLIGAKYVELTPGGSEDMLTDGSFIEFTQDSPNLQNLLEKVVDMAKADRQKRKCH